MTSISKNICINKLDDIVKKYNNTYHSTVKMKHVDIKTCTYIDFDKKNNKKHRKFRVCDQVRTSKYKTTFAKGFIPNWSEEDFVIKKVKNTVPWIYVISDLNSD